MGENGIREDNLDTKSINSQNSFVDKSLSGGWAVRFGRVGGGNSKRIVENKFSKWYAKFKSEPIPNRRQMTNQDVQNKDPVDL
jgi:hypothetical protein